MPNKSQTLGEVEAMDAVLGDLNAKLESEFPNAHLRSIPRMDSTPDQTKPLDVLEVAVKHSTGTLQRLTAFREQLMGALPENPADPEVEPGDGALGKVEEYARTLIAQCEQMDTLIAEMGAQL